VQCCECLRFVLVDLWHFKYCGHKIKEGDIICI